MARLARVSGGNRASLFYIGTTETMDEDVPRLFAKLGVSAPNPELDEVSRHATPAEYSRDLSEKAVANLTEWYAKDIEIYEWCLANRGAINGAHPWSAGEPADLADV